MPPQVRLANVSKIYGSSGYRALNNVNLSFEPGDFTAIMGPSGCGKSTLLNLIAGIDEPSEGEVLFENQNIFAWDDDARTKLRATKIGFIFQFFNLLSTLTVEENIALPLALNGACRAREVKSKTDAMLAKVGLLAKAKNYPAELSGGEMQRSAIARALIHAPALILADEPTGNLDSENGARVLSLLQAANTEFGVTVMMATHSEEAAAYASRQIHMRDGQLVG